MKRIWWILGVMSLAVAARAEVAPLKNNDRVVLLGTAILEQDQRFGYLESGLSRSQPDCRLTFRNLAWTADTLQGHSRSYFGPPADGLKRLDDHVVLTQPTVIFACYGTELAFENNLSAVLPEFEKQYAAWITRVRVQAPGARMILLAPPPMETQLPPRPNLDRANGRLRQVAEALRAFAQREQVDFIDTFQRVEALKGGVSLTSNGVLYTQAGHQVFARAVTEGMGLAWPEGNDDTLREWIVEKDRLFFNRYRPANETYLFLFRKHEQGQNAKEMPMFDPLIQELDAKIHTAISSKAGN